MGVTPRVSKHTLVHIIVYYIQFTSSTNLTPTFMSKNKHELQQFVDSEYFKNPAPRITPAMNNYFVNQERRNAFRSNLPIGFTEE